MTSGIRHIATEPASLQIGRTDSFYNRKGESPQIRTKALSFTTGTSDSDGSVESTHSVELNNDRSRIPNQTINKENYNEKRLVKRGSEWDIIEGLKDGQRFDNKPEKLSGYLHKKRKWPLKGWHKRYFIVDKGILTYGKGPTEMARGKIHGQVDIGLSVISTKSKLKRLDIDADECIYHLKAKSYDTFGLWVAQLKKHRLYRQHVLTFGNQSIQLDANTRSHNNNNIAECSSNSMMKNESSLILTDSDTRPTTRLSVRVVNASKTLERAVVFLGKTEEYLNQLTLIVEQLETPLTDNEINITKEGRSACSKKEKRKFGLRSRKKGNNSWGGGKLSSYDFGGYIATSTAAVSQVVAVAASNSNNSSPNKQDVSEPSNSLAQEWSETDCNNSLSNSNPSLLSTSGYKNRPLSLATTSVLSSHDLLTTDVLYSSPSYYKPDIQLHNEFMTTAKNVANNLRATYDIFTREINKLKIVLESDVAVSNSEKLVNNLHTSLANAVQQNNQLRMKLTKIHELSDASQLSDPVLNTGLSYSSSCKSISEVYFDAEDGEDDGEINEVGDDMAGSEIQVATSDTSSDVGSLSSEDGSISSGNSETASYYNDRINTEETSRIGSNMTGRRTKLPCAKPNTEGLSLWNLLRKNIGKDLSQVSMPVALNEPLNLLQRLCEELEYSDLLDKASELDDTYERMIYVAAFAVSSYGSSYFRAGSKPFNPLLGETYECIREDKGFSFVAEQVSHHPPISVCHADSKKFKFWQDVRIKTKFWGKSMEFQPIGNVNVELLRDEVKEHYRWNKITTCVHNLFSGQRWADQYGALTITNLNTNITCKLNFIKASYWSAKKHEVYGEVMDEMGNVVKRLFGKWNEALYTGVPPSARCIWRLGTMPENYERYYGFTQFAMELNELQPDMENYLPKTDSRFRPDQRLLEEGDLNGAEAVKSKLEQAQRERRRRYEEAGIKYEPRWFRKVSNENNEEIWEFNSEYWDVRKHPGFSALNFEQLWSLDS